MWAARLTFAVCSGCGSELNTCQASLASSDIVLDMQVVPLCLTPTLDSANSPIKLKIDMIRQAVRNQ